jgi:molybdopterin converting factor small subunit
MPLSGSELIAVQIPSVLRSECSGASRVFVRAQTVREALGGLESDYPGLYRCICDETSMVRRHVHLFVNNDLVCGLTGMNMPLAAGDIITIMPAVSGG